MIGGEKWPLLAVLLVTGTASATGAGAKIRHLRRLVGELPIWGKGGYLPEGRHTASLASVYERLVVEAEHRAHKEMLFSGVSAYLTRLGSYITSGRCWIDGALTNRRDNANATRLVIYPKSWTELGSLAEERQLEILSMLSVRDVIVGGPDPYYLEDLHPLGGALKAFLARPDQEQFWEAACSGRGTEASGRGFVEVHW